MKIAKQAYTTEFKELAVKRVKDGQSISTVTKELGLGDQTLRNWVKASAEGKLKGAGSREVTPEEMELSRLRVENLRLKRENEIAKKSDGVLRKGCPVKYAWIAKQGLMHHSDRGSQYASHAFQDKLKEYGMVCSMSRKGNCWDNAPTESWFNSFKNEWVHGIRYATHAKMKATSFEYIEVFYNRKRQHSTLGYRSPIQFMENWLNEQQQEKRVA